jgi:hypothetical protein
MIPGSTNLLLAGSQGYQISRSLRFNSADSAYLNRTPASAGSLTTWTWSGWIKRAALTSGGNFTLFSAGNALQPYTLISFTSDQLAFDAINAGSVVVGRKYTNQVFRDSSAWYHLVLTWDTTNGTAADRMRVYVNGDRVTSFSLSSDPASNATTQANTTAVHYVGTYPGGGNYFSGYLTEINFIDGQALTPSSFGETDTITGVWKPKKYAGTYGTNGFYLNFADNSGTTSTTLGKDSSGNGNNWTPNNFSVTAGAGNDSLVDSPTLYGSDTGAGGEVRGNYCTANPINSNASTLRNGNLEFIGDTGASYAKGILGTIGVSSGKWYFEVTPDSGGTFYIGVAPSTGSGIGSVDLEYINGAYSYRGNGDKVQGTGGGGTSSAYGATYASPDVIGVALDLDNGAIYFAKNNTWQNSGVPTSGSSKTGAAFTSFSGSYTPMACGFNGATATLNFGQRPFAYTAPSGFKALCTTNLPEPTIVKGNSYMDVSLATGNNSTQTITNAGGFQPDLVWMKIRSATENHILYDSVRGTDNFLVPNLTNAEAGGGGQGLTSFNSNGFTLGNINPNYSGSPTFVAWQWDAGSSTVTNTDGTISSQVRANASSGFSVVSFTGTGANATVGHGLGVAPKMVIVKSRSATGDWWVYHESIGATKVLFLSLTDAALTFGSWNNTAPTSSVFSISTAAGLNANGVTQVAYCFSAVAGYSAFGSYTGNGSSDGPFVFTGFRPAYVLLKCSSNITSWWCYDNKRDTYNEVSTGLVPNATNTDTGGYPLDFLSNGFKFRNSNGDFNGSGRTYIYAAFAENPFKYSLAR